MARPRGSRRGVIWLLIAVLGVVAVAVVVRVAVGTSSPPPKPVVSLANCSLSDQLVPSCGVLFGGTFSSFGGADTQASFNNFNAHSGSTASVDHDYLTPGEVLSAADVAVAHQPDTLLFVNWKPATVWSDAGGQDAAVNAQIDAMARSIRSLGTTRILLALYHEPENDVSGGASGCPSDMTYLGSAGTPAQYRAMWANVESRFAALGVKNVVWAMNYMGFSRWNCMVDDLWPGNSLVEWVLWDPYAHDSESFGQSVSGFYNELTNLSDSGHDFLSKPWGLGEFGDDSSSDADQETFYSGVASSLDAGTFPRLKLLSLFDRAGPGYDLRVAYDSTGQFNQDELDDLAILSRDPSIVAGRASVAGGVSP